MVLVLYLVLVGASLVQANPYKVGIAIRKPGVVVFVCPYMLQIQDTKIDHFLLIPRVSVWCFKEDVPEKMSASSISRNGIFLGFNYRYHCVLCVNPIGSSHYFQGSYGVFVILTKTRLVVV